VHFDPSASAQLCSSADGCPGAAQLSFDHVRVPRDYMLMRFAKARPCETRPGWGCRRPAPPWLSQGAQVLGGSFCVGHML